jgi:hypothetical protein
MTWLSTSSDKHRMENSIANPNKMVCGNDLHHNQPISLLIVYTSVPRRTVAILLTPGAWALFVFYFFFAEARQIPLAFSLSLYLVFQNSQMHAALGERYSPWPHKGSDTEVDQLYTYCTSLLIRN